MNNILHLLSSNWISKLIRFPMTSFLAYLLGPDAFGLWVLFELIRSYVSIVGINYGVLFDQRAPVEFQSDDWRKSLSPLYTTALYVQIAQFCLVCFILYLIQFFFESFGNTLPQWYFILLPIMIYFETRAAYFQACLKTSLNFIKFSRQQVVIAVVDLLYILPAWVHGVDGMVLLAPILSALKMKIIHSYSKQLQPILSVKAFSIQIILENFKSAAVLSVSRILSLLMRRFDPTLISFVLGVSSLGKYALASSFCAVVLDISHAMATYLGPKLIISSSGSNEKNLDNNHINVLVISVGLFGSMAVIVVNALASILVTVALSEYLEIMQYLPIQSQFFNLVGASYIIQKYILAKQNFIGTVKFQTLLMLLNVIVFGFVLIALQDIAFAIGASALATFIVLLSLSLKSCKESASIVLAKYIIIMLAMTASSFPFIVNLGYIGFANLSPVSLIFVQAILAIISLAVVFLLVGMLFKRLSISKLIKSLI